MEPTSQTKTLKDFITHGEVMTIGGITSGSVAALDVLRRSISAADTTFIDNATHTIRKRFRGYLVSGKAPRTVIGNVPLDDVGAATDLVVHSADFPDYAVSNLTWLLAFLKGFSAYVDAKTGAHKQIIITNTLRLQGNGATTNRSVHMHGLAVDFRIQGVSLTDALSLLKAYVIGNGLGGYIGRYVKTSATTGQYFLHYDPIGGGGDKLNVSKSVTIY